MSLLRWIRRILSFICDAYSIFALIRDECLPDNIAQMLRLKYLFRREMPIDNIPWFWFLLIGIILYLPEIWSALKRITQNNKNIELIPRKNTPQMWDPYIVWLEIIGIVDTNKLTAILKKLESEKDDAITNHLVQVTKSTMPRLQISGEKLYVAKTKITDTVIMLKDGESDILPKTDKFRIEIDLVDEGKTIKTFKGYLVGSYSDLKIQ